MGAQPKTWRSYAGAAILLWLGGLYALPAAHNLDHRPDHTHGPSTTRRPTRTGAGQEKAVASRPKAHRHGSGRVHTHPHRDPAPSRDPGPDGHDTDPDHGRGSILHFSAAALPGDHQPVPEPGSCLSPPPAASADASCLLWTPLVPSRGPPARLLAS